MSEISACVDNDSNVIFIIKPTCPIVYTTKYLLGMRLSARVRENRYIFQCMESRDDEPSRPEKSLECKAINLGGFVT